eukprot:COSAG02_NODE_2688_length_8234_cov_45.754230_6_plen_225_part_00
MATMDESAEVGEMSPSCPRRSRGLEGLSGTARLLAGPPLERQFSNATSRVANEMGRELREGLEDLVGREVRARLGGAVELGQDITRESRTVFCATICCGRGEWTCTGLWQGLKRLWAWMLEPVPISDETDWWDWWKVFILHFISYVVPLLAFWSRARKVLPGVVTEKQWTNLAFRFCKIFWVAVSYTILYLWYCGQLPTLVRSEACTNVFMCLLRHNNLGFQGG